MFIKCSRFIFHLTSDQIKDKLTRMKAKLDKQKYLNIVEKKGLSEALALLHDDMEALEQECFEGLQGWQPDLYESIKDFRDFSVELWKHRYGPEED